MGDLSKTALLLLDLMNDIIDRNGSHGRSPFAAEVERRRILERTGNLLDAARQQDLLIGFVRLGFREGYPEIPPRPGRFSRARDSNVFRLDSWGTAIHDAVTPRKGEFDVVKHRVSPFFGTSLEVMLRARGIRRLIVSGVSTNAVVQAAVREGSDRDFAMVVVEDCCAAASANEHEVAIATLASFATISTSAELIETRFLGRQP